MKSYFPKRVWARTVSVPLLLLTGAALTHCASDAASEADSPLEESATEASELVDKRVDQQVTYTQLEARYNSDLGQWTEHTAYLGGYANEFTATPGGVPFTRDFLTGDDGLEIGPVLAQSTWVAMEDHQGDRSFFRSTCDGEAHTHTYFTMGEHGGTEVVVDYVCVQGNSCAKKLRCDLELLIHPVYCAAAAR